MLEALVRQRRDPQWQRENGRYIPNPATWLDQGRWEDEPAQVGEVQQHGAPMGAVMREAVRKRMAEKVTVDS